MTDEATETTLHRCPACGESALAPWRTATPASAVAGAPGEYLLLRCRRCGSAALAEGPSGDRGSLYESGTYAAARSSLDRLLEGPRRWVDRDRLRLLGGVEPGERVLEVGAGRGRMAAAIARQGADVLGIEPATASSAAARELGVPVENVSIEDAEVEPGGRDLIVIWHVLEHLDSPAEALARVRQWIADGGRAVISVPNLGSLQARIGGDRWFHQDVPRHRTQFTQAGLEQLMRRSGFRPVRTRQALIDQGLLGMWLTLLNRLTAARDVPFRFLKRDLRYPSRVQAVRDAALTLVLGPPLLALALALETGAMLAGRGGSVVVEARPD
jgi:SAM-dependent methyltransferase